jgi:hypothetical protein
MSTRWAIASHWAQLSVFDVELDTPHCFACGLEAAVVGRPGGTLRERWNTASLERAHLVDHARGGQGDAASLILLCAGCHRLMPSFGDRAGAIAWALQGSPLLRLVQQLCHTGS